MAEPVLSPTAVYSATPTVRVDGEAHDSLKLLLLGMEMREQEGGLSSLEARFSNISSGDDGGSQFAFEDGQILKLGAEIGFYTGDETAPREIFRGKIMGLEAEFPEGAPPELVVLAEDAFQQARMSRRTKVYDDATIADIAQGIAGDLGLTPVITALTDNIGTQVQLNESDLAFLRRLLNRYDGDLQVVGTEMHVSPRSDVHRGDVEIAFGSQLRSVRILADLSRQVTEVNVGGWDAKQGQAVSGTSTGKDAGPGSGQKGSAALADIAERKEHMGHLAAITDSEAQALADAAFDHCARRFLVASGASEGNPSLRVGTNLKLTGLGPRFSNTYYVVEATHRFDLEHGYTTEFRAECGFLGQA
jgi:phage protein D